MKPRKITNEKPLKVDISFEDAMKKLSNPSKKKSANLVELIKNRRKRK